MLSTDAAQPAASAISARFSVPLCLRGIPDKTPKTLDFINYNLSLLIISITTYYLIDAKVITDVILYTEMNFLLIPLIAGDRDHPMP
ncbi:hypothetical protein HKX68_18470 [Dickeya dadantii]|uniref:hypothetical protein n=1 Tax=Dickeya dadantii TaxID=204038 RepID=UPI001372C9E7|nr:hypothetical protein [Dickeya dadantii]NAT76016.1 hypothetical protein [Dickeya dadantii]NPE64759.1 hypothetical protein [Dickeya dadantii]